MNEDLRQLQRLESYVTAIPMLVVLVVTMDKDTGRDFLQGTEARNSLALTTNPVRHQLPNAGRLLLEAFDVKAGVGSR